MMRAHVFHFIVLFAIILGGGFVFWYAQGMRELQIATGIITVLGYVIWGIVHHAIQGDLHRKVVVEYVLLGSIAIILLFTVLGV
ncbi:hypothetical protein A2973_05105 [Candidatus Gottesmanbacteria bacterium RIFCSPLOWO2_01_FULL_49_10]|uniref:Uncharacterized protein n=1 Tax=Candidatus Gottesmanbacteria bacterium RIFCSPLOWO2_01_FULL_49_10 TaxID=1798396 RepID=A0A1F6AZ88_9BACT|nr:MAG: hypothetical protein A2973_05105 [Candidatus Gottesmanbacteria bacterium RIFCSPLOWO2_01_FULL_49_10]